MADLIIKSSPSNNLVIQGGDNSPAITVGNTGLTTFAENATLSGAGNQITSLGTVASGTLGSSVVFNDAHKDIDCDADSWLLTLGTTTDFNGDQILQFDQEYKKGSNITHPTSSTNGQVTCAKAGWYLISYATHNNASSADASQFQVKVNNTYPWGGSKHVRNYLSGANETGYAPAGTVCVQAYVGAGQTVHIYGEGHLYGTTTDGMCWFAGIRLGA